MAVAISYWHVDAFADRPFTGNQAAVMLLDAWLDDAVLQAIAAENMFAETAFLVPDDSGQATRALRWFAPIGEVRLCGHATLAAGHVLLSTAPDLDAVHLRTRSAGILEVRRTSSGYALALPTIATHAEPFDAAVAAIGGRPQHVRRSPEGYTVLRYATAAEVQALEPDFRALLAFGDEQFIATATGVDSDVLSRVFVPGSGIDEDSVTGSAHAVLAPIWCADLGRDRFSAVQASPRGGRIDCRLDGDRVWLEGNCVTVVEGRFYLP